jgi:hypothetical protein
VDLIGQYVRLIRAIMRLAQKAKSSGIFSQCEVTREKSKHCCDPTKNPSSVNAALCFLLKVLGCVKAHGASHGTDQQLD